jgi:hypothetical protein
MGDNQLGSYYTKALDDYSTTLQPTLLQLTTSRPPNVTPLPATRPRLQFITSPRHTSTQSIPSTTQTPEYYTTTYAAQAYYTKASKYSLLPATTPMPQNTTLPLATYSQLIRSSTTHHLLTAQRLLHLTTLILTTTP